MPLTHRINHTTTDELELAPYPQGLHEAPGGCDKGY